MYDDPTQQEIEEYRLPEDYIAQCAAEDDAQRQARQEAATEDTPRADTSPENPRKMTLVSTSAPRSIRKSREPFPVDLLPSSMAEMITAVANSTRTDVSMAGLAALVTAAGCIGNRAVVLLKPGYTEPAVLWGGIVARSGQAKSPVLRAVTRAAELIEDEWREEYEQQTKEYTTVHQKYEIEHATWKSQQKRGNITDPPVEPEHPVEKRILIGDCTLEKLGCLLNENPLGLVSVRDELAGWLGEQDRYSNGHGDSPAWLSMHDAARVIVDRKTAGSLRVPRAAVSLIGGIQPGILRRSFAGAERDSGLLARFLLVRPPETPSRWSDDGVDPYISGRWEQILRNLLAIQAGCDESGKPRPLTIPMNGDAKQMYCAWHNTFSDRVNSEPDDHYQSHLSKLRGMCARLSLITELVQMASTGTPTREVSVPAMAAAISMVDWFGDEAQRVYSGLTADEGEQDRADLIGIIQRNGGSITPRELMRSSRRYPTSDDAELALRDLQDKGYGTLTMTATPGRQAYVFSLSTGADADTSPKNSGKSGHVSTGGCE